MEVRPSRRILLLCAVLVVGVGCCQRHVEALTNQQDRDDDENENGNDRVVVATTTSPNRQPNHNLECDLYVAESTIPMAGMGLFTAKAKRKGEILGNGDLALPLIDIRWNNEPHFGFFPFQDYVWQGVVMGMQLEVWEDDIETFWPGIDALANCDPVLANLYKTTPDYDEGGLHRLNSPGAGAISPYYSGVNSALRPIPAGGELFKNYGDTWFSSRPALFPHDMPVSKDYKAIFELLQHLKRLVPNNDQHLQSVLFDMLAELKQFWESSTLNALPDNMTLADEALKTNQIAAAFEHRSIRSIEELRRDGWCIDHILPGQSKIDGAGHGAFAKRDLPAGTIITGTPLQHVPDKSILAVHNYDIDDDDNRVLLDEEVYTQQLITNYCWGHAESSLLLCPYGSGIGYINHNKTLANVKVRWASHGKLSQNDRYFEMRPKDMMGIFQAQLAFEYVATKDIQKGDELYIDYGDAWETAWMEHVRDWSPPLDEDENYKSAHQYNTERASQDDDVLLRTEEEQEEEPYPDHLEIRCHQSLVREDFDRAKTYRWRRSHKGFVCDIDERYIDKDTGKVVYDVEIHFDPNDKWGSHYVPQNPNNESIERQGIARDLIRFADLPYTTDIHLEGTFRHPMMIPDDMFPTAWKNLVREN